MRQGIKMKIIIAIAVTAISLITAATVAGCSGGKQSMGESVGDKPTFTEKPEEDGREETPVMNKVVYFVVDGKTVETVKCASLESIRYPKAPEKQGYTVKWSEKAEEIAEGKYRITAEYIAKEYKMIFDINGERYEKIYTIEMGELTAPEVDLPIGYEAEWGELRFEYEEREYVGTVIAKKYTVRYTVDGETVGIRTVNINTYKGGHPAVPEKRGYDGEWEEYELPRENTEEIEVKAKYTAKEYTAKYEVDGKVICELKRTIEDGIAEPAIPEREHYEGKWTVYEKIGEYVTLRPEYKAKEYKLTYTVDGEKVAERKYTVEQSKGEISEPEVPIKEGYEGKWEEYELSEGGDREIRAEYKEANYEGEYEFEKNEDGTWGIAEYKKTGERVAKVPAKYKGKAVTKINNAAFRYKDELEEIELPESVSEIERAAVIGCKQLKVIRVRNKECKIHELAIHNSGEAKIEYVTQPQTTIIYNLKRKT